MNGKIAKKLSKKYRLTFGIIPPKMRKAGWKTYREVKRLWLGLNWIERSKGVDFFFDRIFEGLVENAR